MMWYEVFHTYTDCSTGRVRRPYILCLAPHWLCPPAMVALTSMGWQIWKINKCCRGNLAITYMTACFPVLSWPTQKSMVSAVSNITLAMTLISNRMVSMRFTQRWSSPMTSTCINSDISAQIAGFHPSPNLIGAEFPDESVHILGDIDSVRQIDPCSPGADFTDRCNHWLMMRTSKPCLTTPCISWWQERYRLYLKRHALIGYNRLHMSVDNTNGWQCMPVWTRLGNGKTHWQCFLASTPSSHWMAS